MLYLSKIPNGPELAKTFETPEFTGKVIAALYADPNIMLKSGRVVIGAEAALEYGFKDINGSEPPSLRATMGSPIEFKA